MSQSDQRDTSCLGLYTLSAHRGLFTIWRINITHTGNFLPPSLLARLLPRVTFRAFRDPGYGTRSSRLESRSDCKVQKRPAIARGYRSQTRNSRVPGEQTEDNGLDDYRVRLLMTIVGSLVVCPRTSRCSRSASSCSIRICRAPVDPCFYQDGTVRLA